MVCEDSQKIKAFYSSTEKCRGIHFPTETQMHTASVQCFFFILAVFRKSSLDPQEDSMGVSQGNQMGHPFSLLPPGFPSRLDFHEIAAKVCAQFFPYVQNTGSGPEIHLANERDSKRTYQCRCFILQGNLLFYLEQQAECNLLGLILTLGTTEPYAFTILNIYYPLPSDFSFKKYIQIYKHTLSGGFD